MGAIGDTIDEPEGDTITIDKIEEEQEEVEDILEGLLIFPNQKILQSAWNKMEILFGHEKTLMKQSGFIAQEAYDSQLETQSHILTIFHKEMNGSSLQVKASNPDCRSSWVGPKKIEKGIDKNTANRLAAAFERHTERFKELLVR